MKNIYFLFIILGVATAYADTPSILGCSRLPTSSELQEYEAKLPELTCYRLPDAPLENAKFWPTDDYQALFEKLLNQCHASLRTSASPANFNAWFKVIHALANRCQRTS